MNELAFSTYAIEHEGQTAEEMLAESARLLQRQKAIDAMLRGELDPSTVLDMLESHGINPMDYLDCVEDNLKFLCPGLL